MFSFARMKERKGGRRGGKKRQQLVYTRGDARYSHFSPPFNRVTYRSTAVIVSLSSVILIRQLTGLHRPPGKGTVVPFYPIIVRGRLVASTIETHAEGERDDGKSACVRRGKGLATRHQNKQEREAHWPIHGATFYLERKTRRKQFTRVTGKEYSGAAATHANENMKNGALLCLAQSKQ